LHLLDLVGGRRRREDRVALPETPEQQAPQEDQANKEIHWLVRRRKDPSGGRRPEQTLSYGGALRCGGGREECGRR
jgi:hypothetical protein